MMQQPHDITAGAIVHRRSRERARPASLLCVMPAP